MRRSFAFILLTLVTIACGGGTPTGSGSPTPTGSATGEAGEFLSLAQQGFEEGSFKVTYEITSSGGTGDDSATTITLAKRGEESSYRVGSGGQSTLIIDRGDDSGQIVCSGTQCFRSPGEGSDLSQGFLGPLSGFATLVEDAGDLPGFSSTGSQTIAGREAECAAWDYQGLGNNEMCIDSELGVMLRWSYGSPDGSTATWEVVEFDEPTDKDFKPTGDVQTVPSDQPSY